MVARRETTWGLALALLGPTAVSCAFRGAAPGALAPNAAAQGCLVAVTLAVLWVARSRERLPWSSLGLRRPGAGTVVWGVALAAAYIAVAAPIMVALLVAMRATGFDATVRALARLPFAYRIAIVLVDATIEEFLYRGYAIGRLSSAMAPQLGPRRAEGVAAALSTFAFAAAHAPLWGAGVAAVLTIPGILGVAFYLWRRDLAANILAHAVTDLAGLTGS
jgi:uncharacterized protein